MGDENQIVSMTVLISLDKLLLEYDTEPLPHCNHETTLSDEDHMIHLGSHDTINLTGNFVSGRFLECCPNTSS